MHCHTKAITVGSWLDLDDSRVRVDNLRGCHGLPGDVPEHQDDADDADEDDDPFQGVGNWDALHRPDNGVGLFRQTVMLTFPSTIGASAARVVLA